MLPAGIDVMAQFERVTDFWAPKVIARVNDQFVKIAKVKGTLAWHSHVRHNPVAEEECWIVLIEPVSTKHTGEVQIDKTRSIEEQLA